jgi:hypothetical protein
MHFKDVGRMRESTLKRLMRLPHFDEHLELHRLDCLASSGNLETYDLVKRKFEELPASEIKPTPLITGDDLIAAGYHPGPRFGEIRDAFRRRGRAVGTSAADCRGGAGVGAGSISRAGIRRFCGPGLNCRARLRRKRGRRFLPISTASTGNPFA